MKENNKKKKAAVKEAPLTKSLAELMKDEDGFVSKQTILKVGLSTVAALGVVSSVAHASVSHNNTVAQTPGSPNCLTHTNITTHSSY